MVICPKCGLELVLKQSRYGTFYGCLGFPGCDITQNADQVTGDPIGKPTDQLTRDLRIAAHDAFDPIWRDRKEMKRNEAYKWLSYKLGIARGECHIGLFDKEMCERVIEVCRSDE